MLLTTYFHEFQHLPTKIITYFHEFQHLPTKIAISNIYTYILLSYLVQKVDLIYILIECRGARAEQSERYSWEGAQFQKKTLAKYRPPADHVSKTLAFWLLFFTKCHKPNAFDYLFSWISTPPY